jgi:hypothetical protein
LNAGQGQKRTGTRAAVFGFGPGAEQPGGNTHGRPWSGAVRFPRRAAFQRMRTPLEAVMLRLALLIVGVAFALPVSAATFTVTTTADSGAGSLRQAILDSNTNGINDSDMIAFNIPGAGPHVIAPLTILPQINTRDITIDGYTQPGSSPNTRTPAQGGLDTQLRIVLSSQNLPNGSGNAFGLIFGNTAQLGTRTVRGLAMAGFDSHITILANMTGDVVIEGNFIGADAAGVVPAPVGLLGRLGVVASGCQGNMRIGGLLPAQRNLFAGTGTGNAGVGIELSQVPSLGSVSIQGNQIGTDPAGSAQRGLAIGLRVTGVSSTATGVLIGGTDPNARNLISGNLSSGISLQPFGSSLVDRVIIEGNWIGTDSTGLLPLPNGVNPNTSAGIIRNQNFPGSSRSRIGGSAPGAGNRIAFNIGRGIIVSGNGNTGDGGTIEIGDNEIYANTGIPFDNTDRPRANDPGDADVGTNRMQNHPEILGAVRLLGGGIAVDFRVDTAVANATYPLRVDFYRADPGGGPLAKVGTASIAAVDAQSTRSIVLTDIQGLGFLTAMATDAAGNSSEYADVVDLDRILRDGFETP